MSIVWIYLVSMVAFLGVDAVWLQRVMAPLFQAHVGPLLRENMRLEAAVGFYAMYVAGILYFATLPALRASLLSEAVIKGALIGFMAYGTYEATNMTTLKGWTWSMVITDTAWGVFLTALTAVVGYWAAPYVGWKP